MKKLINQSVQLSKNLLGKCLRNLKNEIGATAVEFGLIAGLLTNILILFPGQQGVNVFTSIQTTTQAQPTYIATVNSGETLSTAEIQSIQTANLNASNTLSVGASTLQSAQVNTLNSLITTNNEILSESAQNQVAKTNAIIAIDQAIVDAGGILIDEQKTELLSEIAKLDAQMALLPLNSPVLASIDSSKNAINAILAQSDENVVVAQINATKAHATLVLNELSAYLSANSLNVFSEEQLSSLNASIADLMNLPEGTEGVSELIGNLNAQLSINDQHIAALEAQIALNEALNSANNLIALYSPILTGGGTLSEAQLIALNSAIAQLQTVSDESNEVLAKITELNSLLTQHEDNLVLSAVVIIRPHKVRNHDDECINHRGVGIIKVGIYGSSVLDASKIDVSTVTMGGMGVKMGKQGKFKAKLKDLNQDGIMDLKVGFKNVKSVLPRGESTVVIAGKLINGKSFSGTDLICITDKRDKKYEDDEDEFDTED